MRCWPEWPRMQLASATALIAFLFIVILSVGYASSERAAPEVRTAPQPSQHAS
jgi:hypothetical protein